MLFSSSSSSSSSSSMLLLPPSKSSSSSSSLMLMVVLTMASGLLLSVLVFPDQVSAGLVGSSSRISSLHHCQPVCQRKSKYRQDLNIKSCVDACTCRFFCQAFEEVDIWNFTMCYPTCYKSMSYTKT